MATRSLKALRLARTRLLATIACAAIALIGPQAQLDAASLSVNHRAPGVGFKDDHNQWYWTTPDGFERIKWYTGENTADGLEFNKRLAREEDKFLRTPLRGRKWQGFSNTDPGPQGSKSFTSGEGGSYAGPRHPFDRTKPHPFKAAWNASWRLKADGVLGKSGGAVEWSSIASSDDPLFVFDSDLAGAGIAESEFALLIGVGIDRILLTENGGFSFRSWLESPDFILEMLAIEGDASGVSVAGSDGIVYYVEPPPGSGITLLTDLQVLTLDEIGNLIGADLIDGRLDTRLRLLMYLPSVMITSNRLPGGQVLASHLDSMVDDAAERVNSIPEPRPMGIVGVALMLLVLVGRRGGKCDAGFSISFL